MLSGRLGTRFGGVHWGGLLELDTVVGIAVGVRQGAAAEADADEKGTGPDVEVLHDGEMWIRERHRQPYGRRSGGVAFFSIFLGSLRFSFSRLHELARSVRPPRFHPLRLFAAAFGLAVLWSWAGCSAPQRLGSNAQKPYLWESLSLHPRLAWHRHLADSASVFVQVPAHEPLHLREDANAPFSYSLELELLLDPLEWPDNETGETPKPILYRYGWQGQPQGVDQLTAKFTFPLPIGRYRIVHTVRDVHRGADVTGVALMDGWSEDAPVRCLPFDATTGQPAWENALPNGRRLGLLVPPDRSALLWTHEHLPPVDSFPSAPFLDRNTPALAFSGEGVREVPVSVNALVDVALPEGQWAGWSCLTWTGEPGIHRWSDSRGNRQNLIPVRRPHFPVMRDLNEMIRATRYIAQRQEYLIMKEARDPKKALDDFWLAFADNAEDGRRLISTYYGRVRDANVHFSGLKEGWCTDRGMVHILFGHADRVRRDAIGETWIYGEEGDVNALIFRFTRQRRGDDFNDFELERYPGFRSPWEAMVASWRRGKVRKR